jgi:hypothetical protein
MTRVEGAESTLYKNFIQRFKICVLELRLYRRLLMTVNILTN